MYISLNTRLCRACWKCVEACPQGVIGKSNLPFHKHARIDKPDDCKGCLKCVKACSQQAITVCRNGNMAIKGVTL
ncbi:MAG: 4Fe-4S dicluster domain-containing protein [Dehalococcoidia bacterium]|nr:MAG: 4Fe-4S dicluster domain-containing protein [Dehalococcoidia bacterium]